MIDATVKKDSPRSYSPFLSGGPPSPLRPPVAPVPTGTAKLVFAVRWTVSPGKYFVGFRVGNHPDGITMEIDQFDLLDFAKFQKAAIAKRGVFAASHESRMWAEDLHKAFQAGTALNPKSPPFGFKEIVHPAEARSAVS